jgi:hypothetical protein
MAWGVCNGVKKLCLSAMLKTIKFHKGCSVEQIYRDCESMASILLFD